MEISKKMLYIMSLATLFVFPFLAFLLIYFFSDLNFFLLLKTGDALYKQIFRGLLFGTTSAFVALWLVQLKVLQQVTSYFIGLFKNVKLNFLDILFFSFCAGFGEEIFFRVAMQNFCGIWFTALFFIAIHGYLSLTKISINLYGIVMVVVVAGFGYLAVKHGIWSAVAAHFVFDVIMFLYIKKFNSKNAIV